LCNKAESEGTKILQAIIDRLLHFEPIQYIFGHTIWNGLDLLVTPATLIPRPETAELVETIVNKFNRQSIVNRQSSNRQLYLAPMEDVTDPAFRALCKRYGADRIYTEFVNADALVRDIASTTRKLTISDAERPVAIQIYGREPEAMRDAALIVEQAKPDFIDINFGCPVKKVAGKGAGAGLLRDVPKMLEITRAVVNAVHTPVTAKTRLGWDDADLHPRVNPLGLSGPTTNDFHLGTRGAVTR
jgi:hypothetical protein